MHDVNGLPARLASKIEIDASGHWLWVASTNPRTGYAQTRTTGSRRTTLAHRYVYELLVGPIPAGLQIDHLCRVRRCVNPEHMEPVTQLENVRRGLKGEQKRSPICRNGHEKQGVEADGTLYCLICPPRQSRPPRAQMSADELRKVRELDRRMREMRSEEIAARKREWRLANRDRVNEYQRSRRAAIKAKAAENEVDCNG